MPDVILRRTLAGLVTIDEAGREALRRIQPGSHVRVKLTGLSPRNEKRLRWWWAGVGLTWENLTDKQRERWPTPESLHEAIKVALGYCEVSYTAGAFKTPDGATVPPGTMIVRPGSIAFGKMAEEDFAKLCDRFVDLICAKVLPGVRSDDLRRDIEGLVGISRRAA